MFKHLSWLKKFAIQRKLPIIPVCAADIKLLFEPNHFYKYLLDTIRESKSRIGLSALYLGTGSKESQLVQALLDKLTANPAFEARLLLDYHRARRINVDGQSSISSLEPLKSLRNFELSLIKLGDEFSFLDKFQKWNEIQSTYHCKFGVFDRDVLITGANLSEIYFGNRQDRYMVIKNSNLLSDYIFDLAKTLSKDHASIANLIHQKNIWYSNLLGDPNLQNDTYIIPLLQHKIFKFTDIDDFLTLLCNAPEDAEIYMSTGYFNPGRVINSIKFKSVLAPSEKANGFYGGQGLLSFIPKLYASISRSYLKRHDNCQLYLYEKPDWSFHAKGIWIKYPQKMYMHVIGSSNFNLRSSERDLEFQLVVLTTNKDLFNTLEEERKSLWSCSNQLRAKDSVQVDIRYKAIIPLLRSFL